MNFKNNNSRILAILAFLLTQVFLSQAVTIKSVSEVKTIPVNLRCDYRVNPLGIENQKPNLSWQTITSENNWLQSAYQIYVSTSHGVVTDTGYDVGEE